MLVNLHETSMGYQVVKVILKNWKVMNRHLVLNAEFLIPEESEVLSTKDIHKVEPVVS